MLRLRSKYLYPTIRVKSFDDITHFILSAKHRIWAWDTSASGKGWEIYYADTKNIAHNFTVEPDWYMWLDENDIIHAADYSKIHNDFEMIYREYEYEC